MYCGHDGDEKQLVFALALSPLTPGRERQDSGGAAPPPAAPSSREMAASLAPARLARDDRCCTRPLRLLDELILKRTNDRRGGRRADRDPDSFACAAVRDRHGRGIGLGAFASALGSALAN